MFEAAYALLAVVWDLATLIGPAAALAGFEVGHRFSFIDAPAAASRRARA